MADLGGSIDELDLEFVGVERLVWLEERLSNGDLSLLWTHNGTSEEEEVLVDNTVVWETTDWSDSLGIWISFGGGIVQGTSNNTGANSVDLMVQLSSVVVTKVTRSSNSPLNGRWMPGTNTADLSQTSVGLSSQSAHTRSLNYTLSSLTSSNGNGVNHLVISENLTNRDFTFELRDSPVDLIFDGTTVNLDLHKVSLSLSKLALLDLRSSHNSDNLAVFGDSSKVSVYRFLRLLILSPLLSVLGESLLFGAVVVLVESSNDTLRDRLSPDSGKSSETTWSLDVTLHTNNLHWWALDNGDGFDNILFDGLFTLSLLEVTGNMSHTSFVALESSQMNWFALVVLRIRADGTLSVLGTSFGHVAKMALSGVLEFTVRHNNNNTLN